MSDAVLATTPGAPTMLAALRGPALLGTLIVMPVVLWALGGRLDESFRGSYSSLTAIAVALALTGTAAFALNLVLGARLRLAESLFDGLDRMYRAHRVTGQVAFVLLLGHVVLILASRATISRSAALDLLGPAAGWTVFSGVLAFSAMTVAIVLTLFVRLGHEVFVYVQRSFGLVFLVATYHVFTTPGARDDSLALNAYLVVLATLGMAAFVYRSLLGSLLVRRRRYEVTAVNRLDELVTEIVMTPISKQLAYLPGQFVFVTFRSDALRAKLHPFELSAERQVFSVRAGEVLNQFHPFSITSAPGGTELRLTVKAVGDYTRALRALEAGAEAIVEGPYGSFSSQGLAGARQVWLAGGIGITPFLSMARSIDTGSVSVDLYYCVEHEAEAHFLPELHALADKSGGRFRVRLVPRDREGLLTGERLTREQPDLEVAEVLVCGPPAMIEALRAQLRAAGLPATSFHAEEFAFAKLGRPHVDRESRDWTDGRVLAAVSTPTLAAATLGLAFLAWTYARGR